MNKSTVLAALGAIILLIVLSAVFMPSENYVKSEIEGANYCNVKDDCTQISGECPFGCYIFVNRNETDRIKELIDSYEKSSVSRCIYDCMNLKDYDCINSKCEAIYN